MIKVVEESIPIYSMSSFLLPKKICNKLDDISNNFWWNGLDDKQSLHMCSWKKLIRHKSNGGIEFTNNYDMNLAILSKLYRKILKDTEFYGLVLCYLLIKKNILI